MTTTSITVMSYPTEGTGMGRSGIAHSLTDHTTMDTGELLNVGHWIGIGSTCKRNTNPEVVSQILDRLSSCINYEYYKVHLFGFKKTGLRQANIKDRIHSADSFAYDFDDRMKGKPRTTEMRIKSARKFGKSIIHNNVQTNLL